MYARALRASPLLEACLPGLRAKLESAAAGYPPSFADHAERLPLLNPFPVGAAFKLSLCHLPLPELHLLLWCSWTCVSSGALLFQPTCGLILAWPRFVLVSLTGHLGAVSDSFSAHWTCLAYLAQVLLSALPRSAPGSPSLVEQPALTASWLSNLMFSLKHS